MALVLDPSDGVGGNRRNGVVGVVPSSFSSTQPPRSSVPFHPRQQHPANQGQGAQSAQATHATPNANNNTPRPPPRNNRRGNGAGKKSGAGQSSTADSLNLGSGAQSNIQPSEGPSRPPPRKRNPRQANNNNNTPQTSSQAPPNGGPNRRRPPRRNKGGQRPNDQSNTNQNTNQSNATHDTNDAQAINPATGQPISKRAAARQRAKARKAAARAQQQQQGTQNGAATQTQTQPQTRPQTQPHSQPQTAQAQPRAQPQARPQAQAQSPLNGRDGQASSVVGTQGLSQQPQTQPQIRQTQAQTQSRPPLSGQAGPGLGIQGLSQQPQTQPQTQAQTQSRTHSQPQPQARPPLNGRSGQTSLGLGAQGPSQQPRPNVFPPNNGASTSTARSTASRPPEPIIRTPTNTTVPAPPRSNAPTAPLNRPLPARVPAAFPAQLRFGANNPGDDSDEETTDHVRDTLARMGIAVTATPPVALRNTTTRPSYTPLVRRPVATSPCSICLDEPDEFPRQRPTSRCTHRSTICAPCLEQHISHAVQSQGLTTLTCPDPGCRQAMEYADIIRGARNNRACRDRYEALLLRRTLENEPNFVWCKSPTCDWGQVHESGAAAPIVICQACRARSCFTHDVPWHTGLTCAQYTAQRAGRAREDQASQAYIDRHAKICPNPCCRRRIEKSEGCDHMTCRAPVGCGHEFCWLCLADYDPIRREGNHRHAPTCQHYAPIESRDPFQALRTFEALERARQERARLAERVRLAQAEIQPPTYRAFAPPPPRPAQPRPAPAPAPAPVQSWWNWLFS